MTTLLSPNRRAARNVVPHNTPNFETVSCSLLSKPTNYPLGLHGLDLLEK